jgi:TusA-related sulfurtransferase
VILELAANQAEICRVFSNAKRVLIVWLLKEEEMTVSEIAVAVDCSLQNTSQHLRLMKDKDILVSHREGNCVYYRIKHNPLMAGCRLLDPPPTISFTLSNINPGGYLMSTIDLTTVQAAKVVDARGSACPGPLLEAKKGIGAIKVNEVLEIWSGDPRTKEDIPKWSKKVGHEFLGVLVAEGGYDRIFIKRLK